MEDKLMETVIKGTRLVSITDFNKGKASKIFRELKNDEKVIVMKNNRPIAVISAVPE